MATNPDSARDRYEIRHARRGERLGLTGPLLLIALGVMFLVGQFVPAWGAGRTWPVLLIIIGLARLIESAWAGRSTPSN
jgi:LiaI-LiaF-like transmembrane region